MDIGMRMPTQCIATNANDPHHKRHVTKCARSEARERGHRTHCAQEETSCVHKCGGKGRPAWLCPASDECQVVDEVGTEQSSDADSDLFGLNWGDESDVSINNSVLRLEIRNGVGTFIAMMKVWVMKTTFFMEFSATDEIYEVLWWQRERL